MLAPAVYGHYDSEVYGYRLEPGDILQAGDCYPCRFRKKWQLMGVQAAGHRLEGRLATILVRPLPVAEFPPKKLVR